MDEKMRSGVPQIGNAVPVAKGFACSVAPAVPEIVQGAELARHSQRFEDQELKSLQGHRPIEDQHRSRF